MSVSVSVSVSVAVCVCVWGGGGGRLVMVREVVKRGSKSSQLVAHDNLLMFYSTDIEAARSYEFASFPGFLSA